MGTDERAPHQVNLHHARGHVQHNASGARAGQTEPSIRPLCQRRLECVIATFRGLDRYQLNVKTCHTSTPGGLQEGCHTDPTSDFEPSPPSCDVYTRYTYAPTTWREHTHG